MAISMMRGESPRSDLIFRDNQVELPSFIQSNLSVIFCDVISQTLKRLQSNYLYLYKYENVCLCVCLCFPFFLESDWDTLWHKCILWCRNGSKTIKKIKKLFSAELLPFFYISLRFLCKFEERLQENQRRQQSNSFCK